MFEGWAVIAGGITSGVIELPPPQPGRARTKTNNTHATATTRKCIQKPPFGDLSHFSGLGLVGDDSSEDSIPVPAINPHPMPNKSTHRILKTTGSFAHTANPGSCWDRLGVQRHPDSRSWWGDSSTVLGACKRGKVS